jgi:hypothetical protein
MTHHKKTAGSQLPPTSKVTDASGKTKIIPRIPSGRITKKAEISSKNANDFLADKQPNLTVNASKITSNITTAMRTQNDTYSEVGEFLQSINLDKYLDKMVDNGIEDLETVLELQT